MFTSGTEALRRRDELEEYVMQFVPRWAEGVVSEGLSRLTGLAPSWETGPRWKGSEARAAAYIVAAVTGGGYLMVGGGWVAAGALLVVAGARSLTAGAGHQFTHTTKGLPWGHKVTKLGYDLLSAALLVADFETYRREHGVHHAKAAGPGDPDWELWLALGVEPGVWGLAKGLVSPVVHGRFFKKRLAAVAAGPKWRWAVAAAAAVLLGGPWLAVTVVGYQMAAMLSMRTLHFWGMRPDGVKPIDVAEEITMGRLLIPEASPVGLAKLPLYALVRLFFLQNDLISHDLHHIGKGPWTDTPWVRTRLLKAGVALRQTVGVRAMFRAM